PTFSPGRIVVAVQASAQGLLVVNEALYTGWSAWVDGAETPIVHANGIFMAVPVSTGSHNVILEYQPPGLRAGLSITAVAVVAVAIGIGLAQLGRMRRRAVR